MKRLHIVLLAITLVAAMVVPFGVVNAASPQEDVSGSVVLATTGYDPKIVGTDELMKGTIYHVVTYTGSVSGTGTEACHMTYNLNSLALASVGVQTFTGTILGKTGTLTFRVAHTGFVALGVEGESIEVEQTIISGTGELANLRGTMHFTVFYHSSDATYRGDYSGKLHFSR